MSTENDMNRPWWLLPLTRMLQDIDPNIKVTKTEQGIWINLPTQSEMRSLEQALQGGA